MVGRNRDLSLQAIRVLAVMLENPGAEYWGTELSAWCGLKSGTIYPLLKQLETKRGLLTSRWESIDPAKEGRPPRRLYKLTGEGEVVARTKVLELDATIARVRPQLGLT